MASVPEISIGVVKLLFKSRFRMAEMLRGHPRLTWVADRILFNDDDIIVLPRDESVVSKEIVVNLDVGGPEETVLPSEVLKTMIKRSKVHVIMHKCICRDANKCDDYPIDMGCIFLGPGAANIPESVGRRVDAEEALAHVDRCHDAGLVHIIGRNKIDSVWLNTGPKEELLTICNCCPCCCLWKMLPNLPEGISSRMTAMPGIVVRVDADVCVGCGGCVESKVCFVNAIGMEDGRATIDTATCRGCGRCVQHCEHDAIDMEYPNWSVDESISRVTPLVDVEKG